MAELSPMMQQYLEIKNQHKDEILFYRIGDFYEMFFDDAVTASRELDLTLTGKQCGLAERAPMCGVPFHSYEGYVARLIAKGYKVAICEQVEDPAKAKGLVKRDIIRVVTPGTVIESSMLQDDRNNYIASLYLKGKKAGLCFADVSTGTAHITELAADKIAPAVITELCRYHPSEVLLNPGLLDCREVTAYIKKNMNCSVELVEDERYAPGLVASALEEQFGRDWPQTTGMVAEGLVRFAMAALLEYLHDTQIKGVERLKTVITYNEAQFMRLSPVTRANLELTETLRGREKRGTLLWVLDKTSTAMGKRMLRSWIEQPLISSPLINHRLNAVEALVRQTMVRGDLTEELHYIADLERLMTRTVYGSATPKEIYTLAQTCDRLPGLRKQAEGCNCPELAELAASIDPLEDIKARIYAAVDPDAPSTLKDGGVIAKGYHAEVDELRSIRDNTKGVLAQLEARLRQETGIPKLKIGYNHVFGYFIEVSNSYKNLVPETYIRKQTLTSGERYITQELKELESKILGAHERLISLERRLFDELLESIGAQLDRIQRTANAIAQLDVLAALAQVAAENNYCRPVVDDSDVLTITEGRHPVVEQVLKGSMFVPNDTTLNCTTDRCLIITGPNMAGKSTYMRQNALIALMAQIGCFVPAECARIGIVDKIFTRVGASDNISVGESTFMVEMNEASDILNNMSSRSLVLFDELGRGTSTYDGISIAWAIVEYIHEHPNARAKTLFATHYHELNEMEASFKRIKNYNVSVKEVNNKVIFLRKLVPGGSEHSFGIHVAKMAGMPKSIVKRSNEILKQLETENRQEGIATEKRKGSIKSKPVKGIASSADGYQLSFFQLDDPVLSQVRDEIKNLDVNNLTPLEALNKLSEIRRIITGK